MFHHFHGKEFPKVQGSISQKEFLKILSNLKKKKKILNPVEYFNKINNRKISNNEVCITFDDAIKSQVKLILPILDKLNIKAFFFVYTSLFKGEPDNLEYYRDFRCMYYKNLKIFYKDFYKILEKFFPNKNKMFFFKYKSNYLKKYKFYTDDDRKFRFCRDVILSKKEYEKIMNLMMKKKKYSRKKRKNLLFMNKTDIKKIDQAGHVVGIHSHSHPTTLKKLSENLQYREYKDSKVILESLLRKKVWSMSHPCGSYNNTTLKILKKIGIKIGFRSNLIIKKIKSKLEIPRQDHASFLIKLK